MKAPRSPSAQLRLEECENRLAPASFVFQGHLVIVGTSFSDNVYVVSETHSGLGFYRVRENGADTYHYAPSVSTGNVLFLGGNGNDYFVNYTGLRTLAFGQEGNDVLAGGSNDDLLDGGEGADSLYGNNGNDTLRAGNDFSSNYLHGGNGSDWLIGGHGTDVLVAGYDYSTNVLEGGLGSDYLYGGYGNDNLQAGFDGSVNYLLGSYGDDRLQGGYGTDYLYGEAGNDVLFGSNGVDVLYGGAGNDRLFGQADYDYLLGEDGNDFLDDGNRAAQEYAVGGNGMDFNADVVAISGTTLHDVHQRGAPSCSFLASLAGLANLGYNFNNWIYYDGFDSTGMPFYRAAFWTGSNWQWERVSFDGTLTGTDTAPAVEGESWVVLMQRGWIQFHGSTGACWPEEAIYALVGRSVDHQHFVSDSDFDRMTAAIAAGKVVVTATRSSGLSTGLLVGNHAYTVLATWGSGANRYVLIRNPWGYDGGSTTYGDANDGLMWVSWSDFLASMNYLGIA